MQDEASEKYKHRRYLRRMLRLFLMLLVFMIVVFVSAGRLTYWQGWVYCGVSLVLFLTSSVLFISRTDLVEERAKPGPGTKWWDKIFFALYLPMYLGVFLIACLDAGRFGWSPSLPIAIYIFGYVVLFLAHSFVMWAMWTNRFFSSTVRIQTDRGHAVVQDGPYRFMRHPGYVGGIVMPACFSLVLGSLWGLIPSGGIAVLLIIRTYLEDVTLQKELPGYAAYAGNVKYRLIPGIW